MLSSTCSNQFPQTLLDSARPFLRGDLESIDKNLPSLISIIRSVGAGECWHRHGSFFDHLFDIYRILTLWKVPRFVTLFGLLHSGYSNSYVNLAIFDPLTDREKVRQQVGSEAERLIYLFCVVPRHTIIWDDLVFHFSDEELVEFIKQSQVSLENAKERGVFSNEEGWRKKLQCLVPAEGVKVKHIKTGEDVHVSRRILATFIMMTMADFCDQLFSFQDKLFDNFDGRLDFKGNNFGTLWPGECKPGLWMNSISRLGAVYTLIVREEDIFLEERKRRSEEDSDYCDSERDEDIVMVMPPVFEKCTKVLDAGDQIVARELYWEAVCGDVNKDGVEELLGKSIEKNPFMGEPYVVLSQVYLTKGRFEEAERQAERGLTLLLEWGCPWDKRISWEGWISWTRILITKAREKSWPHNVWGIINLGLVK